MGSVTVTTHGKNVLATYSGNSLVNADFVGYRIIRDGTTVIAQSEPDGYLISFDQNYWNVALSGLDATPAAGAHTYALQMYSSDSPTFNGTIGNISVVEINE
jgi:hypothetical protein